MIVDAQQMALQYAQFDVAGRESYLSYQLDLISAQKSAFNAISTKLRGVETAAKDLTGTDSIVKNGATLSSDSYFDVDLRSNAKAANFNLFVEQTASTHQLAASTGAANANDVMASGGSMTIEINGEQKTIDFLDADKDGTGDVTYAEFASYFNEEFGDDVQLSLVRTSGEISMLFSSENEGEDSAFTISATADSGLDGVFGDASDNPIKQGQDAIVWLGDYGSGQRLQNSSNTFENLVDGVDITLKQAQDITTNSVGVKIAADSEQSIEAMREFITLYNELLTEIDRYTATGGEDGGRGVLASDSTIRGLTSGMNSILRSDFDSGRLFELGIEVDRSGKMKLDESKFTEALSTSDVNEILSGDDGLFASLSSFTKVYSDSTSGSLKGRIDTLDANERRVDDNVERLEMKYEKLYERYLGQFTRLNTISTQMSSFEGLFTTT
ncbi:flagellar filament capping protein FliD [Vibrio breoganii]